MARNYNEQDLKFYQEKEFHDFRVIETEFGFMLEWKHPAEAIESFAIYKKEEKEWTLLTTLSKTATRFHDTQDINKLYTDYRMTLLIEGDLIIENGDLTLTSDYECARQDIINRIRTQKGDWGRHENIGGNLELLEGQPNTRETAYQGVKQIQNTLTYDGRFHEEDLHIRPVPTHIQNIEFYTLLDTNKSEPIIVKENLIL